MDVQPKPNLDNFRDMIKQKNAERGGYVPTPSTLPDTVSFSGGLNANMRLNKEKSIAGPVFDGKINGKEAVFKMVDKEGYDISYYEGAIGGKMLQMQYNDNRYVGSLGTKAFDLHIDYDEPNKFKDFFYHTILGRSFIPDYFNIKGTIDGKEFSLHMPDTKIPKDDTEKDILSLILFDNGLEAMTFSDNIVELNHSNLARSEIRDFHLKRDKRFNEDIKPLISQAISTISGIVIGSFVTALMAKYGLKK